jgi:hydrogenase expression/formation protein HypE
MSRQHERVLLAHGNGGRLMRELIEDVFARELADPGLDTNADAVMLALGDRVGDVVFTTDGFTVQPLDFPGGDIGSLAVHGTTNDLAVAGADPRYLALNAFIEEGLGIEDLRRWITSLARTAREVGVSVACGDTKVVPRGHGGGLYLATTGIGVRPYGVDLAIDNIRSGDVIVVSGPIGVHGTAVMLAREQFGLRGDLRSDAASVLPLTRAVRGFRGLRFMRDPTRGGIATVMHEMLRATRFGVRLVETAVPVEDPVIAVCEMLGFDPYYLACEGRVVAVADPVTAQNIETSWRSTPGGEHASIIGSVTERPRVVLETALGGERCLEELEEDPLPRIC